jgi:hypothetical protein
MVYQALSNCMGPDKGKWLEEMFPWYLVIYRLVHWDFMFGHILEAFNVEYGRLGINVSVVHLKRQDHIYAEL